MTLLKKLQVRLHERNILKILLLVWESSRKWTVMSIVLVIIDSIFPILILYATKLVLDSVTETINKGINFESAFDDITFFIVMLAFISSLSIIFRSAIDYSFTSLSEHVTDHLYTILQAKASEVDLESYENPEYYDILYRARKEVSHRPTAVIFGMMRLGKNGFSLLGVIILLISFDPIIAIILIMAGFPGIIARFIFSRKIYDWQREQSKTLRNVSYFNSVLTSQSHAKENRLFGVADYFMKKSLVLRDQLRTNELQMIARYHVYEVLGHVVTTCIIFFLFAIIIQRTLLGSITIGDLVMYYQAFERGQNFLRGFLGGVVEIYENSLFISNLYEFLDLEPKIVDPETPQQFPNPIQEGIIIKDLSFHYPSSTRHALKNINITIGMGESIAIVGENGSGKTTLVKLLCRLYEPSGGSIEIDGLRLEDFKVNDLRSHISVVFQDYVHYDLTARENIRLGRIEVEADSDKVIEAAEYSGAAAVISKLENGYETILGKRLDEGEELSIGEWQKIAISRAYLRDSQIMLFDEPTSALDAKAEQAVFEKFQDLAKDKLTILISHRLSTIKLADRIYYLNDGIVVESGTHDQLIAQQGLYATMFEAQAKNYRY